MRRLAILLLTLAAFRGAFAADPAPVVLLSFDGLSADAFTPASMPRTWKIAEGGWRGRAVPPFPATTFNGHATLSTGCWPGHHGVVANAFLDPQAGFVAYAGTAEQLQREPLWVAATRSGGRTAVYHWVAATGPWQGVEPWRLEPYVAGRPDREALAFVDHALADGARLVMAYLSGLDEEGHRYGPGSPQVKRKLAATDALLAPWLERQVASGARIVLTSDHGMARMRRSVDLLPLLDGLSARVVAHGGSAYIYLADPGRAGEAVRRARRAGLEAWSRDEVPAELRLENHPRIGHVVVLAPMGTWISQGRTPSEIRGERSGRAGAHGYRGEHPRMHGWLVVLGAGRGDLGQVPLWDLAPTLAAWLGITWAAAPDGKPIQQLP